MKKNLYLAALLLGFTTVYAQQKGVGINTSSPQATLDVKSTDTDATLADAVLVPRMDATTLNSKNAAYTSSQNGALVFVLSGTGTTGTKTELVTGKGFYYFDATAASNVGRWIPVGGGVAPTIAHNYFERVGATYGTLVPADLTQLTNALLIKTSNPPSGFNLPNLTDADTGKVLYIYLLTGSNSQVNFTDPTGITKNNTLQNDRGVTFISAGSKGWIRGSY